MFKTKFFLQPFQTKMYRLSLFLLILVSINIVSIVEANQNEIILVEDESETNKDAGKSQEFKISMKDDVKGGGEPFVPTREWQPIKPGQVVPRGIHMRLNLQTGEREGKLLDDESQSGGDEQDSVAHSHVLSKELENALKNLNDDLKISDQVLYTKR